MAHSQALSPLCSLRKPFLPPTLSLCLLFPVGERGQGCHLRPHRLQCLHGRPQGDGPGGGRGGGPGAGPGGRRGRGWLLSLRVLASQKRPTCLFSLDFRKIPGGRWVGRAEMTGHNGIKYNFTICKKYCLQLILSVGHFSSVRLKYFIVLMSSTLVSSAVVKGCSRPALQGEAPHLGMGLTLCKSLSPAILPEGLCWATGGDPPTKSGRMFSHFKVRWARPLGVSS